MLHSETVLELRLAAAPTYDIAMAETLEMRIPGTCPTPTLTQTLALALALALALTLTLTLTLILPRCCGCHPRA